MVTSVTRFTRMRNPNATPPRVIAETFRNALTCLPHRAWQAGSGRYQVMSRNWHHMFPHELAFWAVRTVRTVRPACMPSESFIRKGLESIGPNWKSNAIIEMEPASKFYEVLLLAPLVRTHRLTVRYTTCSYNVRYTTTCILQTPQASWGRCTCTPYSCRFPHTSPSPAWL